MTPANTPISAASRPRVGIPWRTSIEEEKVRLTGQRGKTQNYIEAVQKAGGEAVPIPLTDERTRDRMISELDAFVLPGSPADVNPEEYRAKNRGSSNKPDVAREKTDRAILEFAFAHKKPVLAICYGHQNLNVYLKGSLIQDIRTEFKGKSAKLERHRKQDPPPGEKDPLHKVTLEPGSRLAALAGAPAVSVNSAHHQAIDKLGDHLKITARANDGIVEGVEWTGDTNWVVGVQWHPERLVGDTFSESLFREFVTAATKEREAVSHKT